MRNLTLIKLLGSFKSEDLNNISVFLGSPYFNTNPTVIALFEFLRKFYPDFKDTKLSRTSIIAAISPHKSIKEGTLRNLMKDLTMLLRKFMIQQQLEIQQAFADRLLFQAYSEKKLKKSFDALYVKKMVVEKNNTTISRYNHLEQFLMMEHFYHFPHTDRIKIASTHIKSTVANLDRFFVWSQLLIQIESASRLALLQEQPPKFLFADRIPEFISELPEQEKPLFNLLQLVIEIQKETKKSLVDQALQLYRKNYLKFSGFDSKMILKILINQMNKLFQDGDIEYLRKMFLLYRFGLENGILLADQTLTVDEYLNIVNSATRSHEIKWTIEFIEANTKYLLPIDQVQVKKLATLIVQFEQGKYNQVSKTLLKNPFRNMNVGFRYKLLVMKGYIEQAFQNPKDIAWILKRFKVIERNIQRIGKKGENKNVPIFLNFIKVAKKILRYLNNKEKLSTDEFKLFIADHSPIVAKKWLFQKINALEQPGH